MHNENLDELLKAIKKGDIVRFKQALADDYSLAHSLLHNVYYPIHVACEYNRLLMVKLLVTEHKVDVNSKCKLTGYTPLMYACQVGNQDIIDYLAQKEIGSDLSAKSLAGRTVYEILVDSGFLSAADHFRKIDNDLKL